MQTTMSDRILLIDDDEGLRESLTLVLAAEGYEVTGASDGNAALAKVEACTYDVILCDLRMPGVDGMDLLPRLRELLPQAPIVMMSAFGTEELALEAMNRGAADYLAKPFQPSEALFTLRKARERERLQRTNHLLQRDVVRAVGERPIVATSDAMIQVLETTERAAAFKSTVLVTGGGLLVAIPA